MRAADDADFSLFVAASSRRLLRSAYLITGDLAEDLPGRAALLACVRELPTGQRAVLVLRYFDDLTEAETARVLGCSIGTVKSQHARALARLRELAPGGLAGVGLRKRRRPRTGACHEQRARGSAANGVRAGE